MATLNPYHTPQAQVADVDDDEVQSVRTWNPSGRIGRVRYIGYTVGWSMLIVGALAALTGIVAALPGGKAMAGGVLVAGYIFLFVVQFVLTIQRCHDFDTTGWLSLLALVPFGAFVFWFVPGTDGHNRFGPKTMPNSTRAVLLALVVPLVAVVGILAAIALPAYQTYAQKAKTQQGQKFQ
jgi:uncharacterized membrane protein YhaH (DUF805 family)